MMEFMTGVKKKETKEITELLTGCAEGEVVKINGAVHVIRDMGVIHEKMEALCQERF